MTTRRPPLTSLIRNAGLAPTEAGDGVAVEVGGRAVAVKVESNRHGVALGVTLPTENKDGHEALLEIVLDEPGDTRAAIEGGRLIVYRLLALPTGDSLRRAVYQLAKAALGCEATLQAEAELANARGATAVPADPAFSSHQQFADSLEQAMPSVTVPAPQPGWATPDPSQRPRLQLQPGVQYTLLNRQGDWARVATDKNVAVFTDGRTLVQQTGGS